MKRIAGVFLLFLLVFLISVVAHTPAAFVIKSMPKVRDLSIQGVHGTIWHGDAQSVSWQRENFGQVSWDFRPTRLFKGKVEFALRFGRGSDLKLTGKGLAGVSMNGLYAENVLASMPVSSVMEKMTIPVPVDVKGQLELTLSEYRYGQPWCQSALGSLVWSGSDIESPLGAVSLGTVVSDLVCEDSKVIASGSQDNSQVSGAFAAELDPNMSFSLDVWFKPGADFPPSMQSQLKWLGDPDEQGRYLFVYAGKL